MEIQSEVIACNPTALNDGSIRAMFPAEFIITWLVYLGGKASSEFAPSRAVDGRAILPGIANHSR